MTRPAKTFLRSRALPDVSRAAVCIAALAAAFVLTARAEAQPNLADGLEILSLYRTADPRIQQAFDQLMDRVPEDVRARVRASTFSEQRSQMTAGQLAEAVKDDTLRVIPTDQGLAAVPLDKIRNGIQGLTDFIIDLPEIPAMIEEHKQRLPEGARSQIPLLVAAARNGIPFARDSIHIAVLDAATTMVDEAQRKIREQIGRDGAEAVLREARNRAAARTASAAGPARPQDPQQPPPLTREQIDQLMVDVPRLIDDADRLWEGVTNIVGQCQNAVNDIAASTVPPDAFADAVAQNNRRKAAAETAMQQAERVIATSAQALRPSVTQAQNASTAACADPKGPSAAANRGTPGGGPGNRPGDL